MLRRRTSFAGPTPPLALSKQSSPSLSSSSLSPIQSNRPKQHPIYGSYMLLFAGYCLACHSAPFALLAVWVCALYYRRRAALEAEVLRGAFGRAYDDYVAATPRRFVPWVA